MKGFEKKYVVACYCKNSSWYDSKGACPNFRGKMGGAWVSRRDSNDVNLREKIWLFFKSKTIVQIVLRYVVLILREKYAK